MCNFSIISQTNIEDIISWHIYTWKIIYCIHEKIDLVLERKDKLYTLDMKNWCNTHRVNDITTKDRDILYTKRDTKKTQKGNEFIRIAGYPRQKEATHLEYTIKHEYPDHNRRHQYGLQYIRRTSRSHLWQDDKREYNFRTHVTWIMLWIKTNVI